MLNPVEWLSAHPTVMPFAIFLLRICDVSLDTIRMICVVRGLRLLAAMIGFVQVLIWLVGISTVMQHLDSIVNMFSYAAGFATGTWVGVWLEGHLAIGKQVVRLISYDHGGDLAHRLRELGFVVTELDGHGRDAPVTICFIAVNRREVPVLLEHAHQIDPAVFVTIEDVRQTNRALTRHAPARFGSPAPIEVK